MWLGPPRGAPLVVSLASLWAAANVLFLAGVRHGELSAGARVGVAEIAISGLLFATGAGALVTRFPRSIALPIFGFVALALLARADRKRPSVVSPLQRMGQAGLAGACLLAIWALTLNLARV